MISGLFMVVSAGVFFFYIYHARALSQLHDSGIIVMTFLLSIVSTVFFVCKFRSVPILNVLGGPVVGIVSCGISFTATSWLAHSFQIGLVPATGICYLLFCALNITAWHLLSKRGPKLID